MKKKYDKELIRLIIACVLFALVFVLDKIFELYTVFEGPAGWVFPFLCYLAAYLILGLGIIKNAVTNIIKGELLDENFLMTVASLGAFALGIYNGCLGLETEGFEEGCAVVVFYSIGEYFQEWAQKRSRKKMADILNIDPDELEKFESAPEKKAKTETYIARFARIYTPVVVGLALIIAVALPLYGVFTGWNALTCPDSSVDYRWATWIYRGLNFLVVSCPCALVISIPLAFFTGITTAGRYHILIKGSNCLELISKAKIFVSEKAEKVIFKRGIRHETAADFDNILSNKGKKDIVVFISDKTEDSDKFKRADVGIAVNKVDAEVAANAENMVLVKQGTGSIDFLKKIADRTMLIVRENIIFTIGIKVAVLVLSLFGITNMWFAVFADVGALLLAVMNSLRAGLIRKKA